MAHAEIVDIESIGLELRYTRNGKPFVWRISTDGAELLKDAVIEWFALEALGWCGTSHRSTGYGPAVTRNRKPDGDLAGADAQPAPVPTI